MTHKLWASEWQANYQRYYPWLWTYDGTNIYQTPSFFQSASISNILAWFDEFEPSHSKLEFSADSESIAIRIVPGTKLMTIGFARPVSQNSRNFMIFDLRKGRCIYRVCLLFCCSQNFFSCRYGGSEQFLKEKKFKPGSPYLVKSSTWNVYLQTLESTDDFSERNEPTHEKTEKPCHLVEQFPILKNMYRNV